MSKKKSKKKPVRKQAAVDMREVDFEKSAAFFRDGLEEWFVPLAFEFNKKHPIFAQTMQALEEEGLNGHVVDELMEGILAAWRATVKMRGIKLGRPDENAVKRNTELFMEFIAYHSKETDSEDRKELQFLQYPQLHEFTAMRLLEVYGEPKAMPAEVICIYHGLMKCFDDAIMRHRT